MIRLCKTTIKISDIKHRLRCLHAVVPPARRNVHFYEHRDELIKALRKHESIHRDSVRDPLDLFCDSEPWADECRSYDL